MPLLIDSQRVQQILINLLGNAIKFSNPEEFIEVKISSSIVSRTHQSVKLSVRDYGIGIAPEEIDRIFTPYFKSKVSKNQSYNPGGHGIGLYISKQLA